MASFMIQAKSLDPSLQVEAISSATYIIDWFPHLALDGKIPFEAWCGRKPVVSHFRVFGYPIWANISSRGCKTPTPRPCTFIGYEDGVKAYRLMDLETHEIFVQKDVHFEESSPRLSSNPLRTSYIVESNSDTSNSASIDSNMWGPIDRYRESHCINTFHMQTFPQ